MKIYAVLDVANEVRDIMRTDTPLENLVHPDLLYLFIEINEEDDVQVGDIYNTETETWERKQREEIDDERANN